MTGNIKTLNATIKEWAKINLAGNFYNSQVGLIQITMGGIKETLNQPRKHQKEKAEAIYKIEQLLTEGEFVFEAIDKRNRPLVWYYLKVIIAESNSYIVIREDLKTGSKILYSIVDGLK